MVFDEEINEIKEEINIDKIETNLVNNVIPKAEEFGESNVGTFQQDVQPIFFWAHPKENQIL